MVTCRTSSTTTLAIPGPLRGCRQGCLSFPGGQRGCGWFPASRQCQVHLARTVSGRGAVVPCLLCAPGLQILSCTVQHRSAVNINGNSNRRRLVPAPGAVRDTEWGQGLLHVALQLSVRCLQPPVLSPVLEKAPQAWLHRHPSLTLHPYSKLSSQNPALAFCRGEAFADLSPSLALGRAGAGGAVLSFFSEIILCGPLQQWLRTAAPSHCQTVMNTNKRDEPATVG